MSSRSSRRWYQWRVKPLHPVENFESLNENTTSTSSGACRNT